MTKKDYILIAKAIKQTLKDLSFIDNYQEIIKTSLIENISSELYYENYKFNKEKFCLSCQPESEVDTANKSEIETAKNLTNELVNMYNEH